MAKTMTFVEWIDGNGGYHGGNYANADLPRLYKTLQARGIDRIFVEDTETSLSVGNATLGDSQK